MSQTCYFSYQHCFQIGKVTINVLVFFSRIAGRTYYRCFLSFFGFKHDLLCLKKNVGFLRFNCIAHFLPWLNSSIFLTRPQTFKHNWCAISFFNNLLLVNIIKSSWTWTLLWDDSYSSSSIIVFIDPSITIEETSSE